MDQRIKPKLIAIIDCYVAFQFSLIVILHLALMKTLQPAALWLLTFLLVLLSLATIFNIRFSNSRLRIFDLTETDITSDTKARARIFWSLVWRFTVCLVPFSIVWGLGGAAIVGIMNAFPIVQTSWLIYPTAFVYFWVIHFMLLYPILYWWLRSHYRDVRIVAVNTK